MNKKIIATCLGMLMLHFYFPITGLGSTVEEVYVSTEFSGESDGTIEKPFTTLEHARDAIRTLKQNGNLPSGGALVYVRQGRYQITDTFRLTEDDSGKENAPIVYRAFKNEKVYLSGGDTLNAQDFAHVTDENTLAKLNENAKEHILEYDLTKAGIQEIPKRATLGWSMEQVAMPFELFVDGEASQLARYPNEGRIELAEVVRNSDTNTTAIVKYTDPRFETWSNIEDVFLRGNFFYEYSANNTRVLSMDKEKDEIQLQHVAFGYGKYSANNSWRTYYAYNILEELDQPGEYYIDRDALKLYYYPQQNLENAVIQLSRLTKPLIVLNNSSHIEIRNMTLENTGGMGIYIEGGESNKIVACTIRNMGQIGVMIGKGAAATANMGQRPSGMASERVGRIYDLVYDNSVLNRQGGKDHEIVGCDIYNMGQGGIFAYGGDRLTITPGNIRIVNNKIHRNTRLDHSNNYAVWISGVGNKVQHNEIYDAQIGAVLMHGNEHVIEYNEIHDVLTEGDDAGAIYTGRDPSGWGNIVRYNYFYDINSIFNSDFGYRSVYFDDCTSGGTIYGNVFKNASGNHGAFHFYSGLYNNFENNIVIDSARSGRVGVKGRDNNGTFSQVFGSGSVEGKRLRAVGYKNPPYSERYPLMATIDEVVIRDMNTVQRNVFYRTGSTYLVYADNSNTTADDGCIGATVRDNYSTDTDPGFVNQAEGNYALLDDSIVYQKIPGFEPIPFSEIGRYTDENCAWGIWVETPVNPSPTRQNKAGVPNGCILNMYMDTEGTAETDMGQRRIIPDQSEYGNHGTITDFNLPTRFSRKTDPRFRDVYSPAQGQITKADDPSGYFIIEPSDTMKQWDQYTVDVWIDMHHTDYNRLGNIIFRENENNTLYRLYVNYWSGSRDIVVTEVNVTPDKKMTTSKSAAHKLDVPKNNSQWVHITVTKETGENPKIYVNGQEKTTTVTTGTVSNANVNADHKFYFGSDSRGVEPVTCIGPLKIFDGPLTPDEIAKRYMGDKWELDLALTPSDQRPVISIGDVVFRKGESEINSDFSQGDEVTASVPVAMISECQSTIWLVLAYYDTENRLLQCAIKSLKPAEFYQPIMLETDAIKAQKPSDQSSFRAFTLNMEGLSPLAGVYTIPKDI